MDGSVSVIGGGRGSVEGMHMMLFRRLSSTIDLFLKWQLINCSFIFMEISLTSLVSMCKLH